MPNESSRKKGPTGPSPRTFVIALAGAGVVALLFLLSASLSAGGHMMGPTHINPGNVGLVIDNYSGNIERQLMPAGTHWQGPWERVIEVPTAQRTLSLSRSGDQGDPNTASLNRNGNGGESTTDNAVQVNTVSNMMTVDVSVQYQITAEHAADLYKSYQDQFADINRFESENLEPAVKGAINYAIGDMDTATALTTVGKQQAESTAKKTLNDEWAPRGIVFSNVMIRGIQQDEASQQLLSTTLQKMQDIENAKLGLQQQRFDNMTMLQQANAEAQINRLQNSTLTDLYVQDQLLGRVKKVYLPSSELMGILKQ